MPTCPKCGHIFDEPHRVHCMLCGKHWPSRLPEGQLPVKCPYCQRRGTIVADQSPE